MGFIIKQRPQVVPITYQYGTFNTTVEKKVGGRWPGGKVLIRDDGKADRTFVDLFWDTCSLWESFIKWAANGRKIVQFVAFDEKVHTAFNVKGIPVIRDNFANADLGYFPEPSSEAKSGAVKGKPNGLPHELGHTMGLAHEQVRPSDYKTILNALESKIKDNEKNTQLKEYWTTEKKKLNQQTMYAPAYVETGTFDKHSIMMYPGPAKALGVEGNTDQGGCDITDTQVTQGSWKPSAGDLQAIIAMYG